MKRPIAALLCLGAAIILCVPASASPNRWDGWTSIQKHYLSTYEKCWHSFHEQCGRNLLDYAWKGGKPTPQAKLEASTATMERWLSPAPSVAMASPTNLAQTAPATSTVPVASGGVLPPESIKACESGGDYGAVNGSSGAYGAWQILPSTSAAYGCDMSSPAGQDACAAKIWAGGAGAGQWTCAG